MLKIAKKISLIALIGALCFTAVPSTGAIKGYNIIGQVSYTFTNQDKGSATGTIKLEIPKIEQGSDDVYSVYWADSDMNKLSKHNAKSDAEYSAICEFTSSDKYDAQTGAYKYEIKSDYAAIPEGAAYLLACNKDESFNETCDIPSSKQSDWGEKKNEFALMSDVHYNRYPEEGEAVVADQDLSVLSFYKALQFVDARGIDKVFLSGDLSNQGEVDAYNKFNKEIAKYPKMTVYSCMGNHDVSWTKSSTKMVAQFKKYVNTKKSSDANVVTIAPNNLDFVYKNGDDYVILFSQIRAHYSKNNYIVEDEQLDWLHRTLNSLANKNVYILFHTYFANYDGNVSTGVGNLKNPGGYTYNLTYPYGAVDEVRFRKILNQYSNVTVISGHSHWAYDQVKYNPNLVIGNIKKDKKGATLLHLSSVGAPRTIEENATERIENFGALNILTGEYENKRSEGTVATKYADKTVYTGVDFISGKYLGNAVYMAKDGEKHAPEAILTLKKSKITKVGKVKKISKKSKKYKVKITFKKISKRYKYQVQYSTNSKFKSKNKNKYTTKTSYTITKLKCKTKYYVRVRAYAYQFGSRVNGAWSAKKKIKTKK